MSLEIIRNGIFVEETLEKLLKVKFVKGR